MRRAAFTLAAGLLGFAALEAAVFRSGLYLIVAEPGSTAGYLTTILHNEEIRPKEGPNQILAVGDSRMFLLPRVANETGTGYTYASIAVPGTTPRCWYYMLRSVDPQANLYRAVIVTLDSYDDPETWENHADRESDMNYLIGLLGFADLEEFSNSYEDPALRARARRAILLKGWLLKRDFQGLLRNPWARVRDALHNRRDSHKWIYEYPGEARSLAGLEVDFERKTLKLPPGADAALERGLKQYLLEPAPPDEGRHSAYLKHWLGRIYDHYRNSATQLIFLRLPRGPYVRPDLPPFNPHASVRLLAREPNVILLREDLFDSLEVPEKFQDQMHLNRNGLREFSLILAREIPRVLGPAR